MRGIHLLGAVLGLVTVTAAAADRGPAPAFVVGEQLHYRVFWGPLLVGEATLAVRSLESVDDHPCYHLVGIARTVGIGRLLYPVDSVTESWLDRDQGCTRRFRQDRREGRNHRRSVTHFDYVTGVAVTSNLINGKTKQTAVAGPVQDMLSCLYYIRQRPLAVDAEEHFVLHAGNELWTVAIRPDQRRNLELRPVGKVDALRIEPEPTLKIVASNKGRMWVWVSDDHRHLPLTLTSTMSIGAAKLVLYAVDYARSAVTSTPAIVTTSP
ncbi:DUF3108 domain-containing protein [bacterium]|nr:DUF3108 domain-containing protein [bacterium]